MERIVADAARIRRWLDEATDNIERIDNARGLTPSQHHINALLRPREARVQLLCDWLLEILPAVTPPE